MIGPRFPILLSQQEFSPYRLPGLEAAYDFTDSAQLKVDASNRVSFAADKSGNSAAMGLVLSGVTGNSASTPSSAALNITGDIDLRIFAAMDTWSPAATNWFFNRASTDGQASYDVALTNTGVLNFRYTPNGTFASLRTGASSVAVPFAAFAQGWIRATYASGTGVVTFYTSADGITWTQLGTTATITSGSIFAGTNPLSIGSQLSGNGGAGKVYRAQIYNGIAGTLVLDANFTAQTRGATSFTESSANAATVTINSSGDLGARICGARDMAMLTGSKQPLLLSWSGANYAWNVGVSGNSITAPDAPFATSQIEIVARLSAVSWANTQYQTIICKDNLATQRAMFFGLNPTGNLALALFPDGTTQTLVASSAAVAFAAGALGWVKVTWRASDGRVQFFTAADTGSNTEPVWVQLGTNQTNQLTNIFDSTAVVSVFQQSAGGGSFMSGNLYFVAIRHTIGGTNSWLFDASQAAHNATSWTSSTGETWTVNSTGATPAQIVGRQSVLLDGSDDYLKAPPFTLNQPATVVFVGKPNTWVNQNNIFDGDATNNNRIKQEGSTPQLTLYAGSGGITAFAGFALGSFAVLQAVSNAAASSLRTNRNTATSGSIGTNNAGGFQVGVSAVQVARAFVFSVAVDTATLDKIAAWVGKQDLITV